MEACKRRGYEWVFLVPVCPSTLGSVRQVRESSVGVQVELEGGGADAVVVANIHVDPSG